jgi:hypothetical protein
VSKSKSEVEQWEAADDNGHDKAIETLGAFAKETKLQESIPTVIDNGGNDPYAPPTSPIQECQKDGDDCECQEDTFRDYP